MIPRLDVKGPNLVKGIHLEGLRVLGKPEKFARHYYETGADELLYVDAVASLYGRNRLESIIENTSRNIFIPLTVAGGLRSVDDIRTVLRAGADKVALNTAALQRPEFVQEASLKFGSSTITVSIEAIKIAPGKYEAYTDNGRESTDIDVVEWAQRATELGAGEILLTSIDREGTGRGYDLELTRMVATSVSVPVVACGGAGNTGHIAEVVSEGRADAVSAASMFHYDCLKLFEYGDAEFDGEGNLEFLKGRAGTPSIPGASISEVKLHLLSNGIQTRPPVSTNV